MLEISYRAVQGVAGPLIFLKGIPNVSIGEIVRLSVGDEQRIGQVIEIRGDVQVAQVFKGTSGVSKETTVHVTGEIMKTLVSDDMFGRIFDGFGKPIDGKPPLRSGKRMEVSGAPINPTARAYPQEFIETGISAIDGLFSLVRGQKLPVFSGSGLPHNQLIAQIVRQARIPGQEEGFGVILAGIGVNAEEAEFFRRSFQSKEVMKRTIVFMNLMSDPTIERLITPRIALTAAEYLAFEKGYHILVLLTDMTNYCEALREVSMARGETPARRGYPGYMYTDLASLYERSGRIVGKQGSITTIPVISMPDYDITHPIPDLTGFITEGQIVLSQEMHIKNIYPPLDILPSLSRLMKDGVGAGTTRGDHLKVSDAVYSAYARGKNAMDLSLIMGEETLTREERNFLAFAESLERRFIRQGGTEHRAINETLDLAQELLKSLE
ncbi:MAG: V-type ATP synthase subunit B [Candidatus Bathyarchaeota archaeon]